ncbi:C-type lectin domain family 12 member A [Castor canadensis]|uniref:C-type lectin domain family 12 member A n=2 Tax=Castor canadensis TaxID=51338 RepID=A0A250YDV8_CASCN
MSEEVTYANLKFQDSGRTETVQKLDSFETNAPPASSHTWCKTVLALILLCLLLFIGLGVLGSMYYKLQNTKEELQRNVSLQLMDNINSSEKIRSLSITLQKLATKLCHKLYNEEPEHQCKPCPKSWTWHKDSCYYKHDRYATWIDGNTLCSAENGSLLKIKNNNILEFVKSKELYNYWLGLSPRKKAIDTKRVDENIISSDWFEGNTNVLNMTYCGYIHKLYVYYDDCTLKKNILCEKKANSVKAESMLMSEVQDERV